LCVDGLPGDEPSHHLGLAAAGRELERQAHQIRVGVAVGRCQVVEQPLAVLRLRRDSFSQIAVSTASTWQKNGRTLLNECCRQCWSKRVVSGVTCHWLRDGSNRQALT